MSWKTLSNITEQEYKQLIGINPNYHYKYNNLSSDQISNDNTKLEVNSSSHLGGCSVMSESTLILASTKDQDK